MEKLMRHYDKESMKIAMLQHEETFKHQVHELHRLYRVQRMLMNEIKAEIESKIQRWNGGDEKNSHKLAFELHLPAEESIGEHGDAIVGIEDSDLELTLATGYMRKKSDSSVDSGASLSSSSIEFQSIEFDDGEQDAKERMKQSPWLSQCLSFNIT